MFAIILIDIIILLALGVPTAVLHRRWRAWIGRQSGNVWPFRGRKHFGLRSWAARSFVLDAPPERVKEAIDGLPEMSYAEAADIVAARGRTSSFLTLAPLTGRQVFETGIRTDWIAQDTVEIHSHSYSDWPLNALDDASLPAKQHQMLFEHALLRVEPQGDRRTRVSYELQTPVWMYLLRAGAVMLIGWAVLMIWHRTGPGPIGRINLWVMAVLVTGIVLRATEILQMQSVALMDGVISKFGPPVPR